MQKLTGENDLTLIKQYRMSKNVYYTKYQNGCDSSAVNQYNTRTATYYSISLYCAILL